MTAADTIEQLLDQLDNIQPDGQGWKASCPIHDDQRASMSINPGQKGWLVHCFVGCDYRDIVSFAGLTVPQLFYDYTEEHQDSRATMGLRSLMARNMPVNLWKLERFDDVAWVMWPYRFEAFIVACVHYQEVVQLSFPESMKYWTIIRDGFLFDWLGADTWPDARHNAAAKLWSTWRQGQGATS